jgi:hypothetical protein
MANQAVLAQAQPQSHQEQKGQSRQSGRSSELHLGI